MKNVLIGILVGIVLCAVGAYIMYPKVKQVAHDDGYAKGLKEGTATGMAQGITKGIAEVHAEQKRVEDSIADAQKRQEEIRRATRKPKKDPPPVQNWHVIDGKIADPVVN